MILTTGSATSHDESAVWSGIVADNIGQSGLPSQWDHSEDYLQTRRTGSEAFVVYRDMILCCDVTYPLFEAHEILQHQWSELLEAVRSCYGDASHAQVNVNARPSRVKYLAFGFDMILTRIMTVFSQNRHNLALLI